MASLYQLTAEYQALLDLGDSADPEDQQAFLDTLEGLDFEVGLKADSYAAVRQQLKARKGAIDTEIMRLQALSNACDKSVKRLEDALLNAMITIDKKEIKTDFHRFRVVGNGGKQPMTINEDAVPAEYTKTVVTVSPDKEKIRAALEAGKDLGFAQLQERGKYLKID